VDVTNNSVYNAGTPAPGQGPGPEGSAVITNTTNPGTSTTFIVVANNRGPAPDSYNLGASTVSSFASQNAAGRLDGDLQGRRWRGQLLDHGSHDHQYRLRWQRGGAATVCAVWSASPAGYAAGTNALYFRALSPNSGASDTIYDAVAVSRRAVDQLYAQPGWPDHSGRAPMSIRRH